MKSLVIRFWTDEGFVIRIGAMLVAATTLYFATPNGRPWYERASAALGGGAATGVVSVLGGSPSKEHAEAIAAFEKRIAALEPPKPPPS